MKTNGDSEDGKFSYNTTLHGLESCSKLSLFFGSFSISGFFTWNVWRKQALQISLLQQKPVAIPDPQFR